jgi:lysine-N-methylase
VSVDEEGFERNKHLLKPTEFAQAFKRLTGPASPGEYAYIAKGANDACWFLQADNLCRLQRLAGHGHLDHVCQIFPRYPVNSARGIELTLSFSCPEVLQLVERVEPLRILRADEQPTAFSEENFIEHVFPRQKRYSDPMYYYFELEQHFIDILQYRALALPERMRLLEKTIQRIGAAEGKENPGQWLNHLFSENYTFMDGAAEHLPADGLTAEIITEHYLINVVFQKIFYTHGLMKGLRILKKFFHIIRQTLLAVRDEEGAVEAAKKAVMDLEIRFLHHRSSLGEL